MSSSFPQFSVDEIILRHCSQDLYFMIIHSIVTLTTAKPDANFITIVYRQYYLLVLSFTSV